MCSIYYSEDRQLNFILIGPSPLVQCMCEELIKEVKEQANQNDSDSPKFHL